MKKNKKKLKQLKKKVMWYANILGVSHLVGDISIDKKLEDSAEVCLSYYVLDNQFTFKKTGDETVLHELIHSAFKNTLNTAFLYMNKKEKVTFERMVEQETDRFAKALAKQFPYKEDN